MAAVSGSSREHLGWVLHESGPAGADHTVLLLPGGLCTAAFFDDVLADPRLAEAPVRFVATTLPGFGDTKPLDDLGIESDAKLGAKLAEDLGCDVVVGHSLGANVAIEMAAAEEFSGPLVLLSPSFSHEDEDSALGMLDRIGRVPGLGQLAWAAMSKMIPRMMKGSFPPARHDALVAEMQKSDSRFCRVKVRRYFEYLDHRGSVVSRLCDSGVKAWVAFGDGDGEVGLKDDERRALEACSNVTLLTVPGAGHFTLNEQPGKIAELILDAVARAAPA